MFDHGSVRNIHDTHPEMVGSLRQGTPRGLKGTHIEKIICSICITQHIKTV